MLTDESILEQFINEARAYGNGVFSGKSKLTNKAHRNLHRIYDTAKANGSLNVFSEMLTHDDENVRLWAATFSLTSEPDKAINTIQDLANLPTITAITAETLIKLWREGRLELL